MSTPATPAQPIRPTLFELFRSFAFISVVAFGGALPWARRMIVDQKGWMTPEEFNEAFSLSQFLPGPNVINFSVVFGSRFGGAPGAALALLGLLGPPVLIVLVLAMLYAQYGDVAALSRILGGITSAAAGLLIAMVAKMAMPMFGKGVTFAPFVAVAAFVIIGMLQWPLPLVLAVLVPVSIGLASLRLFSGRA